MSYQLLIIIEIIIYILGLMGNLLNICIFARWAGFGTTQQRDGRNIRTRNSSLYLLVSSVSNLIVIIYPFLIRILLDTYQYQVTQTNVFILCKLQHYILHTFDVISLTCICLATFDRYLVSSRNIRFRQMSTTKRTTKFILLLIILFNGFHCLPIAFYFDVTHINQCGISSIIYAYYYMITFHILLHGVIPISFLTIFGILTFKQLKLIGQANGINHFNCDKQLSRMLLLMSIAIVFSAIPDCIEQIRNVLFSYDDEPKSSSFFLLHIIASLLFYTNSVYSFYIFYVSTPNFRREVHKLILQNICNRFIARHPIPVITPTNHLRLATAGL